MSASIAITAPNPDGTTDTTGSIVVKGTWGPKEEAKYDIKVTLAWVGGGSKRARTTDDTPGPFERYFQAPTDVDGNPVEWSASFDNLDNGYIEITATLYVDGTAGPFDQRHINEKHS